MAGTALEPLVEAGTHRATWTLSKPPDPATWVLPGEVELHGLRQPGGSVFGVAPANWVTDEATGQRRTSWPQHFDYPLVYGGADRQPYRRRGKRVPRRTAAGRITAPPHLSRRQPAGRLSCARGLSADRRHGHRSGGRQRPQRCRDGDVMAQHPRPCRPVCWSRPAIIPPERAHPAAFTLFANVLRDHREC
jgi:hypothetical protein